MTARNVTTIICILHSLSDPEDTIVRVRTLLTHTKPYTQALIPVLHDRYWSAYIRNVLEITFVRRMHHKL
jgi:hypothetical protein